MKAERNALSNAAAMIGLAGAGKSTFLAALYHVAESGQVPRALKLARMPALREHLERIRRDWLELTPQTRTTSNVLDQNVLEILSSSTASMPLFFPDLAGERLTALVEERTCSLELASLIRSLDRTLLFIHPDKVVEAYSIKDATELAARLQEIGGDPSRQPAESNGIADIDEQHGDSGEVEWTAEMVSTQVKLIELLQIVEDLSSGLNKIGIIISAWDRVDTDSLQPKAWLARRLPMLSQYLDVLSLQTEIEVFGVSAMGGDPENDRDRLLALSPEDRIKVVGAKSLDPRDITAPIKWLIG